MSTIANLLLAMDPAIKPHSEGVESVNRAERGRQLNQTGLIELAELKRQQEAQQLARQYYQQHPEALMGQGGGPVLASLQTAPGGPDRGGMSPPSGMPGQDPVRYAGVSPQGGGPIPPDVARQVMPQVTPPGGMPGGPPQGALGTQPQPQANPLMDLMRRNPDAAFAVMERQQQVQTQRLDMGAKVAGGIARIIQGVTDQGSLEQARQDVAMIDPRSAAQLPQFYSKEALEPFIKRAFTAQQTADVRLKTWHQQTEDRKNQLEEMKIGVQLTNAGYQGLGTDVTGILRGLTDEQVKEFGGRVSPKAIAYANDQVKKLDIEKREKEGLAGAQATAQANREARLEKTVSEVMGDRTTRLFDTQTMETVNSRMPMKEYEALPTGRVKELSSRETEQIENVKNSVPIVAQLQTHIDKIYGPGGVLARMTPDERADLAAVPGRWATQYAQKYPEVTQAQRFINSNAGALARALAGEKGAMAEGDVARAKEMLPNLETTLKVWPPANIGIQSPDTRATALGSMNSIVDMINARVRGILGNEQFTHPKLHRYETAADAQQATGSPGTPPAVAPPELPIPPLTRLNPNLPPVPGQPTPPAAQPPAAAVPAPGPPIFPRTPIREPGAPAPALPTAPTARPTSQVAPAPAPGTRPAPPTARSTPAQDEAYRQSVTPQPAPAPSAPATKPTPGRQSQAPAGTRLAGAPKYMNLADVAEAVRQTGKSRTEVERRARELGYTVYGSKLKLPEVTMVG